MFCVNTGTTVERMLTDYMQSAGIAYQTLSFEESEELRAAFYAGRCDAIPGFNAFLTSTRANASNSDDYANFDEMPANPPSVKVERLLSVSPGIGERLVLDDGSACEVIQQVGSYAEVYDRTIGEGSCCKL